ncbi:MAG: hypothetical protein AAGE52_00680 [Myxococcota bacterium]
MDPNDLQRVGGGLPPLGPSPSLEDEERAMRAGKGGLIGLIAALVLVLGGGLAFFMLGGDDEAYETLGQNVNGAKRDLFDGFWGCVFQGREEVSNNEELAAELNERATRGGARFATYIRRECLDRLEDLEPRLRALIPPEDMVSNVNDLVAAVGVLRGGFSDYLAYLEAIDPESRYDEDAARDKVSTIARGWYDFKRAHGELNRGLREHLH